MRRWKHRIHCSTLDLRSKQQLCRLSPALVMLPSVCEPWSWSYVALKVECFLWLSLRIHTDARRWRWSNFHWQRAWTPLGFWQALHQSLNISWFESNRESIGVWIFSLLLFCVEEWLDATNTFLWARRWRAGPVGRGRAPRSCCGGWGSRLGKGRSCGFGQEWGRKGGAPYEARAGQLKGIEGWVTNKEPEVVHLCFGNSNLRCLLWGRSSAS